MAHESARSPTRAAPVGDDCALAEGPWAPRATMTVSPSATSFIPRPVAVVLGAKRDQPFFEPLVSLWASATAASGVSTRKVMDSTR
jgi:hypothetical protein